MADLPIAAIILASGALSANLTNSTMAAAGAVAASGALTAAGTASSTFQVTGSIAASGALSAAGSRVWELRGALPFTGALTAPLSAQHALIQRLEFSGSLVATAAVDGQGLTLYEVARAVLPLIGYGCCADVRDTCLQGDVMEAINAAHQQIFSQAHRLDYFNRTTLEVTFADGVNSATLQQSTQNILKPVRLHASPRTPLHELTSIMEVDHYASLYHGGAAHAPSSPRAFFLRPGNQSKGDNVGLTLYVAPTPAAETVIDVDVSLEPPRYTWADVTIGTPVEMPHRFAETLLIPLVRHWATTHRHFVRKDLLDSIKEQYALARQMLGLVDPASPDTHARKQKEPA